VLALDTNTLIYYFKGTGRVADHLKATAPRDVAIPAVVLFELMVGVNKSAQPHVRRKHLRTLLQTIRVLPFDESCAQAAADIRAQLEQAGNPIGPLDTLIAGTALAHSATLVTHNTSEFSRVPGLAVVDWF
jgi:tRNA(fMet)-specific endonuclease VapC